ITGLGSGTGVEVNVTGGNVTLNMVKLTNMQTGARVTSGKFKMTGGMITGLGNSGYGVSMTGGTVTLEGGVKISKVGTGVRVMGGKALLEKVMAEGKERSTAVY
ncbi:hypothetical protein, partial [Bartonella schoenbuchensis]|uniref:hypothetical protein n=1 Tax=Bartonella schoenbuchensis TaxID=165694 RepID=UPI001ABA9AE7